MLVVPALLWLATATANAQCPPSCPLTGGGDETTDCYSELAASAMHLNWPFPNPFKPKPLKEHRCFDGEAGCDLDGEIDGKCVFDIDVCLHNDDPALPTCTAADVIEVGVKGSATKYPGLDVLQADIDALLPASTNVCTSDNSIVLPLKTTSKGALKRSKAVFKTVTRSAVARDKDKVKLSCVPHRWPSHGFDYRNHRNNPLESTIATGDVNALTVKWRFHQISGPNGGVTSTPTVGRKLVYVTSWNGVLYALDKKTGKIKWEFDTESTDASVPGIQASATLTADGRVLIGDGNANVYCLDARKGTLLWTANVGDPATDPPGEAAHVWGSPTVANGRVFVGRSSHGDQPCTQGHLYAFDLDDGSELWRLATVPANICDNDTSIECSSNGDCGAGTCVPGVGGGVTTTPATSADGDTVYFVTVGCFTSPSIGNSDSFFAVDAATGAIDWVHRTQSIEQFSDGPPYHDYGFLNGPMLATVPDGLGGDQEVLIAGSKDGSLYAVDAATGTSVYTQVVQAATDFAAFGLFNGAIGYADGNVYAALFQMGGAPAGLDRLWAFDASDGLPVWSDREDIYSWADVGLANGVLYVGSTALPGMGEEPTLHMYDAATGTLLRAIDDGFTIPEAIAGGPTVDEGVLYVPFGIIGQSGGVIAFSLP